MFTDINEELYQYLTTHHDTRKTLTDLYSSGQYELANEIIRTLGFSTTIDSFMHYLSTL